ncbi:Alanine--glyoxylate aminotransferase 2, mitochondrial [Halotydeus destructor]|nr:Alanine--glyoxylate aminotransferase 2, mitochondrial [Halotydeus destructor]
MLARGKLLLPSRVQDIVRWSSSRKLPDYNFEPDQYKCKLSSYEIDSIHRMNVNPSIKPWYKTPLILTQGSMQYVYDNNGRRYLDMFGGIVTTSVGHCHPRLVGVAQKQMTKLWHTSAIHLNEEIHEYVTKLSNLFPDPLSNIFLLNSGSEANDLAMVMARLHTKAWDIVALRNAYHGMSPYTMGLCGIGSWKHQLASPLGVHHATNPDPFRGRFGGKNCRESAAQTSRQCACAKGSCDAENKYVEDFDDLLKSALPAKMAGFFVESIQGVGGIVQYPRHYVQRVHEKVKAKGGLLIMDEVQTGFGRTGENFWGFQSHGVTPDIVTMAKGIGNGFPMAALITTPEIASSIAQALHFNTFGGNPLASKIGSTVLDIIEDDKLQANSKLMGDKLISGLMRLRDKYGIVGDIRGQGLMLGIDMVKDSQSRHPMVGEEFGALLEHCKDQGVLLGRGGSGNVFRIAPPMCINEADVKFTLDVLDDTFSNYEKLISK